MKPKNTGTIVLYIGVALLMTHELDAVMNNEWLVLPLTSWLSSEVGYEVFLWFHVPLFFAILALLSSRKERTRIISGKVLSVFLLVHAGLHWLCSEHTLYDFSSISSNLLIYGGAVFGTLYFGISRKSD